MKKVYFVRHGETTYNEKELVQDGSTHLTDLGKHQAIKVAERVQNIDFDHFIVSDYERTKETSEPIVEATGKKVEYSPLFREVRRPSEFFHLPRSSDGFQKFLKDNQDYANNPDWHHSDEENFHDALQRVREAMTLIEEKAGDVLVVSHGHFIRLLTAYILTQGNLEAEVWKYMAPAMRHTNAGITTIFYENNLWRLLTFNDQAHFAE